MMRRRFSKLSDERSGNHHRQELRKGQNLAIHLALSGAEGGMWRTCGAAVTLDGEQRGGGAANRMFSEPKA
jgi:hypothetical protein